MASDREGGASSGGGGGGSGRDGVSGGCCCRAAADVLMGFSTLWQENRWLVLAAALDWG
jgi:hypothetical protein